MRQGPVDRGNHRDRTIITADNGPADCFPELPPPFDSKAASNVIRMSLDSVKQSWTERSTLRDLWNAECLLLSKDGSLSTTQQTRCLSNMLPKELRKLFRKGNKADKVRGNDLWLTRDVTGLVRVSQPGDERPTWLLASTALTSN